MKLIDEMTHEELEILSEIAEEYLEDKNIPLISHSYRAIILQAQENGFFVHPKN